MTTYYLCPWATVFQYFTDNGVILSGGKVYTYLAGTSTPQVTYTDITGAVPNANPIILASNGRLPNVSIWQPGGVSIKIVVKDSNNNVLGTFDQLQGINDLVLVDTALANPASGFGADLVANAVRSYDIFASARTANVPVLQAGQTLIVEFEGGNTVADGLGGAFYWNALSSATDDNLTIIAPTGLSFGRYLRVVPLAPFTAVKAALSSIASSTAIAPDADLTVAIPATGTWLVEAWLNDATGTSAGGLQAQISYTGTFSNAKWAMNGNGSGVTAVALTTVNSAAQFQSAQSGTGSMKVDGMVQATTTGSISFSWAQHSSNVTASVLGAGSWLRVTRLSSATGSFSPVTNIYSTTGVETIPLGASTLTIEGFGGSGGGGRGNGNFGGGGGGSGGYIKYVINVSHANGQTINFSTGAAGAIRGGNGGDTVISSGTFSIPTLTAGGGHGGGAATLGGGGTGGAGGAATGGQTNTAGNVGSAGTGANGGVGGTALTGIYTNGGSGGTGADPGDDLPPFPGLVGSVAFHYI